jgi:3-deoxy-D-manno-octulosonic-acid transferase
MYFFYRILTAIGMLALAPYYALRGWRRGEPARTLRERFGLLDADLAARAEACAKQAAEAGDCRPGAIWIHAVSVGEVLAAGPLVVALKKRFPSRCVFVSTTTETGQRLARERLTQADGIFYFPLDWVVAVRRAMRTVRPALAIVMETEIWPNFLREARRVGVPVIFVNARISTRSFARFKRWEWLIGPFFARAMRDADLFLAQTPEDAARLVAMGAPSNEGDERVQVTGNLKYDAEPPRAGKLCEWLAAEIERQERWPVLVAGSVVAEEEQAVLAAYDVVQRKWRHALLILAPRKPDRFDAAAAIAAAGGWNVVRRSRLDLLPGRTSEFASKLDESADVLVLDSIGELAALYGLADAAFVGGSLVPSGGHNILEPAFFGKPPVFGPSMENFRDMAAQFVSAQAGVRVNSGEHLGRVWVQLIENDALRKKTGEAARALAERNRGATARVIERIAAVLEGDGQAADRSHASAASRRSQ